MNRHGATWGAGIGLLVAVVVVGGIFIGRLSNAVGHAMAVTTGAPTAFDPQPTFFCNALRQRGGLQNMVDGAGIGPTAGTSAETTNLVMLKLVVQASPDRPTHTALAGLYQVVLRGDSRSSAARMLMSTVEEMNPCAR